MSDVSCFRYAALLGSVAALRPSCLSCNQQCRPCKLYEDVPSHHICEAWQKSDAQKRLNARVQSEGVALWQHCIEAYPAPIIQLTVQIPTPKSIMHLLGCTQETPADKELDLSA